MAAVDIPRQLGFTLLEALLSIAIITILAGLSLPIYASFDTRTDLDVTTQSVADMLRRAQVYARGVNGDSQWGVAIQTGSATLFKGATYASRDATYDETTVIAGNITLGGALTEVVFAKLTGAPSTTGSRTLTVNTNEVRTITLNAEGMVNY